VTTERGTHRLALGGVVAICATGLVLAACVQSDGVGGRTDDRTATRAQQPVVPSPEREQHEPPVQMQLTAGLRLEPSTKAELASAARRFATSLADWLYGERRKADVEPTAPELRRELTSAPPYIPRDQIGSGEGKAVRVHVFAQTARSGVLVVTIRDSRTSYAIPAGFELRAGGWQVVHLNTH
jgi:hypothetical protein